MILAFLIDCSQIFTGPLPFIGDSDASFHRTPTFQNEQWIGVECLHNSEKSPHLTGTHVESARHVMGDGKTIHQVILDNPSYLQPLQAFHISITPTHSPIASITNLPHDQHLITYECGETYLLSGSTSGIENDFIITRASLESSTPSGTLLLIQCGKTTLQDWPYLTNEAAQWIYENNFHLVALNLPSFDRESDGGRGSNHKIFFQNPNNLIIESLDLSKLPPGPLTIQLELGPLTAYPDCAHCEHFYFLEN